MSENLRKLVDHMCGLPIEPGSRQKISRHGHEFQMGILAESPTREPIFTKQSHWSSGADVIEAEQLPPSVRDAFGIKVG